MQPSAPSDNSNPQDRIEYEPAAEDQVSPVADDSSPAAASPAAAAAPASPAAVTPMPWKILSIIYLMFLLDSFNLTSLPPYLQFMVKSFNLVDHGDSRQIGYYSGLVVTSFYVAQFLSSPIWGWISDRYGRRPVLLAGMLGSAISALAFGFSKNLWWACIARFLYGILNGNLGCLKALMSEVTDSSNQAKAFSYFSLIYNAGVVVGSIAGGIMSRPVEQHPWLFGQSWMPSFVISFFETFPFVLPNLVASILSVFAFVMGLIGMNETNPAVLARRNALKSKLEAQENTTEVDPADDQAPIELEEADAQQASWFDENHKDLEAASSATTPSAAVVADTEHTEVSPTPIEGQDELHDVMLEEDELEDDSPVAAEASETRSSIGRRLLHAFKNLDDPDLISWPSWWPKTELLRTVIPILACFSYAIIGFMGTCIDQATPLWLQQDVSTGGLNFREVHIGIVQAVSALVTTIFGMTALPILVRKLGAIKSLHIGMLTTAPSLLAIPVASHLAGLTSLSETPRMVLVWSYLLLALIWRALTSNLCFIPINIIVNNSVTSKERGRLNGFSQAGVAFTRSISPVTVLPLLSWTLTNGLSFPFNYYLPFILIAIMNVALFVLTLLFPNSLNKKRDEVVPLDKKGLMSINTA